MQTRKWTTVVLPLFLCLPLNTGKQTCEPHTFYILSHSERYIARNGDGLDDAQEILTPEGFARSRQLRIALLSEHHVLEAIFYEQGHIRSYLTVAQIPDLYGFLPLTVASYDAETPKQSDLSQKIEAQEPCPDHALIVSDNTHIKEIFDMLGFDSSIAGISDFGKFFTLKILPDESRSITESFFGDPDVEGNIDCVGGLEICEDPLPNQIECHPRAAYLFQGAERYLAASADSSLSDDSQEILTPEGFHRAWALRFQFEKLELDYIFTPEKIRFLQTISSVEDYHQVPIAKYDPNEAGLETLQQQIKQLNPCPHHIAITGPDLLAVVEVLGAPIASAGDLDQFGGFFTIYFDEHANFLNTTQQFYGVPNSHDNAPFPIGEDSVSGRGGKSLLLPIFIAVVVLLMIVSCFFCYKHRNSRKAHNREYGTFDYKHDFEILSIDTDRKKTNNTSSSLDSNYYPESLP